MPARTSAGTSPADQPRILERFGIDGERFTGYAARLLEGFGFAVGASVALVNLRARWQTRYLRGVRAARQRFATPHRA